MTAAHSPCTTLPNYHPIGYDDKLTDLDTVMTSPCMVQNLTPVVLI